MPSLEALLVVMLSHGIVSFVTLMTIQWMDELHMVSTYSRRGWSFKNTEPSYCIEIEEDHSDEPRGKGL